MTKNKHIPTGYKPSPLGIIPEDWEVKRLGEVCTFLDSQRIPIKDADRSKMQGQYPYYGASGIIDYVNDYIFDDDLILLGEDGANIITRSTPLAFLVSGKAWINNHAHVLKTNKGYNRYYICNYLESLTYDKYNTGTAQPKLNQEVCEHIPVLIPSEEEQNKISDLLTLWDTAITKQTQLIEKLTLRKKGLMQQLLTGKKRLKGFEGGWKEVKLGEVCDLTKGEQVNSETLTNTGLFPVINGGIAPSGYKDDYNTEANTITISEGGNSCGFVNMIKTKFWSGGHCYTISNIINFDLNYLYYSLKFAEPHIMNLRVGSGLPNIQLGPLQKFTLLMPQLEEQKAIAAILEQADKEIELANKKISYMQLQKKGLMQFLLTGKKRIINH